MKLDIELKLAVVPLFIILYILFRFLNNHVHKLYLKNEDAELEEEADQSEVVPANITVKEITEETEVY